MSTSSCKYQPPIGCRMWSLSPGWWLLLIRVNNLSNVEGYEFMFFKDQFWHLVLDYPAYFHPLTSIPSIYTDMWHAATFPNTVRREWLLG